jgi:predicted TPR repeat methyltransferase
MKKIARNELCECGSNLKYKKCCANNSSTSQNLSFADNEINEILLQAANCYDAGQNFIAEQICIKVLNINPKEDRALYILGHISFNLGKIDEGIKLINLAMKLNPSKAVEATYSIGNLYLNSNKIDEALEYYYKAIKIDPKHATSLSAIGNCYRKRGEYVQAKSYYEKACKSNPKDIESKFILSSLNGVAFDEVPEFCVKDLFNPYAKKFEFHLKVKLGYNAPEIIARELKKIYSNQNLSKDLAILDLGCGTGLGAKTLIDQEITGEFIGVDLSENMLSVARQKNIYSHLILSDINKFLSTCQGNYDLMIAFDVIVYLGKIDKLFYHSRRLLKKDGLLAFTLEENFNDKDYNLQPANLRYSHSMNYIERLSKINGFTILVNEAVILRKEFESDIKGKILILQLVKEPA